MALSDSQKTLINDASPINNDFSVGNRLEYLTTGGNYSSGTVQGCSISSGNLTEVDIRSVVVTEAAGTAESTAFTDTTGQQMNPYGFYKLSTVSSGIHRVSSGIAAGYRLTIINPTTGITGYVFFSTAGTVTFYDTGDCVLTLAPGEGVDLVALTTAKWGLIGSTAGYDNAFATSS